MVKDLKYWKNNAEDGYMSTPICVLRYISELESVVIPLSGMLHGLYSPDNVLMYVFLTKESAKKEQYNFEKEKGMGYYVQPIQVFK